MSITANQAGRMIDAAAAKAQQAGVRASIAVLDSGGHIKAFLRMDGAWLGSIDVAIRKAKTSVLFEAETQQIWEVSKPDAQAHGLELTNGHLVTFAGGMALRSAQGELVGAVGVSGGQVAQDYEIVSAAFSAFAA